MGMRQSGLFGSLATWQMCEWLRTWRAGSARRRLPFVSMKSTWVTFVTYPSESTACSLQVFGKKWCSLVMPSLFYIYSECTGLRR